MRLAIRRLLTGCATLAAASSAMAGEDRTAPSDAIPAYSHIVVIVEENKDFGQIMDPAIAPNIARLARENGSAENSFGEVHPSEANYLALLGGDTFGIHDDDAFYCTPGSTVAHCDHAAESGVAFATAIAFWL